MLSSEPVSLAADEVSQVVIRIAYNFLGILLVLGHTKHRLLNLVLYKGFFVIYKVDVQMLDMNLGTNWQ